MTQQQQGWVCVLKGERDRLIAALREKLPVVCAAAVARDVLLVTAATLRIDPAIYSIVSKRIGPGVYELRLRGCGL